ncbi:MAG: hypothetical protein H7X95_03590, partial [Deltaproteobacteria bacterium]|nr:hypothetical protein [Deltaproteobacteria bacterium]
MLGLLPFAGLLFLAGEFSGYATAVAELRVGHAPVQAGLPPKAGFVSALTPIGELQYARPDRQVILAYGPRILWRQPNALGSRAPLVLNVVTLAATVDATPTVRFIERGSASYGKADYIALSQIFGVQGSLPQLLDIFAVSAGTGLRWDASRTWRYETMFDVAHRRILGVAAPMMMMNPPPANGVAIDASFRQTVLELNSSAIARVTRRHDLVLTTAVSERILHNGVDIFAVTPQIGWRARLARSTALRFAGGFSYVRDMGTARLVGPSGVIRPVGNIEIDGLLLG